MGFIGPRTGIAQRPHRVQLWVVGAPVPDGEGGYTTSSTALSPPDWECNVEPASARDLERVTEGAVATTSITHLLTGPYRGDITTSTVIGFGVRTFYVKGVSNPGERSVESIVYCEEHIGAP